MRPKRANTLVNETARCPNPISVGAASCEAVFSFILKDNLNYVKLNQKIKKGALDMRVASIFYPLIFLVLLYFLFNNTKNRMKYMKEGMEVLLLLDEDDKRVHLIARLLMAVMILLTGIMIRGLIETKSYFTENAMILAVLPILIIALYVPLSKKTAISTLGIHKRSNLVRWEDIKGINYQKADAKDKVKVKIVYMLMNKDTSINLTFLKDDKQLEKFREYAKTYRNTKKKGKKSDK